MRMCMGPQVESTGGCGRCIHPESQSWIQDFGWGGARSWKKKTDPSNNSRPQKNCALISEILIHVYPTSWRKYLWRHIWSDPSKLPTYSESWSMGLRSWSMTRKHRHYLHFLTRMFGPSGPISYLELKWYFLDTWILQKGRSWGVASSTGVPAEMSQFQSCRCIPLHCLLFSGWEAISLREVLSSKEKLSVIKSVWSVWPIFVQQWYRWVPLYSNRPTVNPTQVNSKSLTNSSPIPAMLMRPLDPIFGPFESILLFISFSNWVRVTSVGFVQKGRSWAVAVSAGAVEDSYRISVWTGDSSLRWWIINMNEKSSFIFQQKTHPTTNLSFQMCFAWREKRQVSFFLVKWWENALQ